MPMNLRLNALFTRDFHLSLTDINPGAPCFEKGIDILTAFNRLVTIFRVTEPVMTHLFWKTSILNVL